MRLWPRWCCGNTFVWLGLLPTPLEKSLDGYPLIFLGHKHFAVITKLTIVETGLNFVKRCFARVMFTIAKVESIVTRIFWTRDTHGSNICGNGCLLRHWCSALVLRDNYLHLLEVTKRANRTAQLFREGFRNGLGAFLDELGTFSGIDIPTESFQFAISPQDPILVAHRECFGCVRRIGPGYSQLCVGICQCFLQPILSIRNI
mmetsp:Transcript_2836/g.8322  ORF Transcript_2836/g.8322 Transcript_2836/m.8322 type:complete len:203 (+) Transcript_2836:1535-2143(+)